MKRFVQGETRSQMSLLPGCLDDYVSEDNPVRVVEAFIDALDLERLGFAGMVPRVTGRPAYHPSMMLKLYVYGYLNRVHSSRRLERESQRNVELMWLTERLTPDFKTIANFRKDNGRGIREVCKQFVIVCRKLNLLSQSTVVIDGSKFKGVNNRDRNVTPGKLKRRREELERSIDRYSTVDSCRSCSHTNKATLILGIDASTGHDGTEPLRTSLRANWEVKTSSFVRYLRHECMLK